MTLTLYFTDERVLSTSAIVADSVKKETTLFSDLYSSSSSLTLTLAPTCTITGDILSESEEIKAIVATTDATTATTSTTTERGDVGVERIFTGYLSDSFSWTLTDAGEKSLTLTIEDIGTHLFNETYPETVFNCTAREAIAALTSSITTSVTVTDLSSYSFLDAKVFRVTEDTETIKELLSSLLYELGAVYTFNSDGVMEIIKLDLSEAPIRALTKDELYTYSGEAIKLSRKIKSEKSARVTYTEIAERNALIYSNTTDSDSSHKCSIRIPSGYIFDGVELSEAGEAGEDYEVSRIEAIDIDEGKEVLSSDNLTLSSNYNFTLTSYPGPYFSLYGANNTLSSVLITQLDVYGDIIFISSNNVVRKGSGKAYESTMTWLHDKDSAEALADSLELYLGCNNTYTFYSSLNLSLGTVITLDSYDTLYIINVVERHGTPSVSSHAKEYKGIGLKEFKRGQTSVTKYVDGVIPSITESAPNITVTSSLSSFHYTWYGERENDVTLSIGEGGAENTSDITWTVENGTLTVIDGGVKVIPNSTDDTVVTATKNGLSTSINITSITEAYPSPIYLGAFTEEPKKNPSRSSLAFAPGDFFLSLFTSSGANTTSTSGVNTSSLSNAFEYGRFYEWDGTTWFASDTTSHLSAGLEDILANANTDSLLMFPSFSVITNLIASSITTELITAKAANIIGKITVDNISGEDKNGNTYFEINTEHFKAGSSDRFWELKSDGSALLHNASITGNLEAGSISHESLKTVDGTEALGAIGKSFTPTLWRQGSLLNATKNYRFTEEVTYNGVKYHSAFATMADTITEISTTEHDTPLTLYAEYTAEASVSAGSSFWLQKRIINGLDYPIFIDAEWYLPGNMNTCYLELWGENSASKKYALNDNSSSSFYLSPGTSIGVYTSSSAWWGSQTATSSIKTYETDGLPYVDYKYVCYKASDSGEGTKTLATFSIVARFMKIFSAMFSRSNCGSAYVLVGSARVYSTNGYFDLSAYIGKSASLLIDLYAETSGGEDEDVTYGSYSICEMYLMFYVSLQKDTLQLVRAGESDEGSDCVLLSLDEHYTDAEFESTFFTPERIMISGGDVYSFLKSSSVIGKPYLSTTDESYLILNGIYYKVLEVSSSDGFYAFLTSDSATEGSGYIYIYSSERYDSIEIKLFIVSEVAHCKTKALRPMADLTYDIGSSNYSYKDLYINSITASGTINGNINSSGTVYRVWGAVAN